MQFSVGLVVAAFDTAGEVWRKCDTIKNLNLNASLDLFQGWLRVEGKSLAAIAFFDLLSDAIEPISVIAQVTQLLWLATQRLAQ